MAYYPDKGSTYTRAYILDGMKIVDSEEEPDPVIYPYPPGKCRYAVGKKDFCGKTLSQLNPHEICFACQEKIREKLRQSNPDFSEEDGSHDNDGSSTKLEYFFKQALSEYERKSSLVKEQEEELEF